MKLPQYILRIAGRAHYHGHGHHALLVGDYRAALLEVGQRAQRLQLLKGQHHVGLTVFHQRRMHPVAYAHIGDDVAAALGHAVYLAHLYVHAVVGGQRTQYAAGQQSALPAHAGYHNVYLHTEPPIAENLHRRAHRSQPTHSAGFMRAFLPSRSIAGQPSFKHMPQPLHLSASTA